MRHLAATARRSSALIGKTIPRQLRLASTPLSLLLNFAFQHSRRQPGKPPRVRHLHTLTFMLGGPPYWIIGPALSTLLKFRLCLTMPSYATTTAPVIRALLFYRGRWAGRGPVSRGLEIPITAVSPIGPHI